MCTEIDEKYTFHWTKYGVMWRAHVLKVETKWTPVGHVTTFFVQPQIRKSWDSMENTNKKRK